MQGTAQPRLHLRYPSTRTTTAAAVSPIPNSDCSQALTALRALCSETANALVTSISSPLRSICILTASSRTSISRNHAGAGYPSTSGSPECTYYERMPYSGQLVFAAFSGSHQDAIAKGMKWRDEKDPEHWNSSVSPDRPARHRQRIRGRTSSVSTARAGKGGIGFTLWSRPTALSCRLKCDETISAMLSRDVSDHQHKELPPAARYTAYL